MANDHLDNIILSGNWEINAYMGLQYLAGYLRDLDFIEKGGKFKDLGYADRRKELEPEIVGYSAAAGTSGRSILNSSEIPDGSIAHLRLSGAMRLEDGFSSRGVRQLVKDIQAADANPKISGILLEVNSGGGESSAGTELQNALKDVANNGKTVVGVYYQVLASAALRGTLPVNFIMAAGQSAAAGSVGTYAEIKNDLIKYMRDNYTDYYARQSTLKNDWYRRIQIGDAGPLIDELSKSAQQFIDEVVAARSPKGTEEQNARLLAGAVFSADEALQIGLIDAVGTFGQALNMLKGEIAVMQNTAPTIARGISFNNNLLDMDFKTFLAPLLSGLQKIGINLSEDATPEQVQAAIDAFDVKAEIQAAIEAQQAKNAATGAQELSDLHDRIDQLEDLITSLSSEVTEIKARNLPGGAQKEKGADALDSSKFETVKNFGQTLKLKAQ